MQEKVILSLFDYSGNWSKPYLENGYTVIKIDIKHGIDILSWDYSNIKNVVGILAAVPCTDFALSGARHFKAKDADGRTQASINLVYKTLEIINYFSPKFWVVENPQSRIHKLVPELGKVTHKFNPCDYAGFDPIPSNSQYNKRTWLWGNFTIPISDYRPPLCKEFPGFTKLGGKSERTKELRSITPMGFAYAFYNANH